MERGGSGSTLSAHDPSVAQVQVLDIPPVRTLAPMFPGPYGFGGSGPFSAPNPFGSPPVFTPVFPTPFAHPAGPHPPNPQSHHDLNHSPPPPPPPPPPSAAAPVTVIVDSDVEEFEGTPIGAGGPSEGKKGSSAPRVLRRKMSARKSVLMRPLSQAPAPAPARDSTLSPVAAQNGGTPPSGGKRKKPNKVDAIGTGASIVLPPLALSDNDSESVAKMLMVYDGLRRKLSQYDDAIVAAGGSSNRPALKAGSILMSKRVRVNATRRMGAIPGIEIGDIFYFRFEMCLIGLHTQSMSGIDTAVAKFDNTEDHIAVSIVSAGVYEDDINNSDILIYTGQGGISPGGRHTEDQKLERGNLALHQSLQRGNEIRVICGVKDPANLFGKIYIYDGIYKVQEFWTEKVKDGFNVFKFKLRRMEGQPDGIARWKRVQQWKQDPSRRPFVISCDLSSAAEKMPVCLVNEVDSDKGPPLFTYATRVKYLQPVQSVKPLSNCHCPDSCTSSASKCSCKDSNGGAIPYTATGHLVARKQLIYECSSCRCPITCKNRISQKGISVRFEVFRTKDRGWGLRSWDPIRSGSFVCEFVGEVSASAEFSASDDDSDYVFDGTAASSSVESSFDWNCTIKLMEDEKDSHSDGSIAPLSVVINAKRMGNMSRFINHSCSPNIFWQPVLYDHSDERFPHIAFYALKHIPPMTELTYYYGSKGVNSASKKCLCGSSKCRGYFS